MNEEQEQAIKEQNLQWERILSHQEKDFSNAHPGLTVKWQFKAIISDGVDSRYFQARNMEELFAVRKN